MGDVVGFRKKRLAGFIPDDLGRGETELRRERERMLDLIGFARKGAPPVDLPENPA